MEFVQNNQFLLFTAAVFGIVFIVVMYSFAALSRSARLTARLGRAGAVAAPGRQRGDAEVMRGFLARNIDARFFRLDETARGQLRRELIQAGYFNRQAVPLYLMVRFVCVVGVPALTWLYLQTLGEIPLLLRMVAVLAALFVGYYGPRAWLSRRKNQLQDGYRIAFPEMMDLLLVCVESGLSLEAAIERVGAEIGTTNQYLGLNLQLMAMEMRAGRGTMDSLQSLAERLGIEEARSFATLLRQSAELGTSISQSLRVYSEEMRDRRMARAEERAYALPAKLVIPLALFIFPVILIVVMLPLAIRILSVVL